MRGTAHRREAMSAHAAGASGKPQRRIHLIYNFHQYPKTTMRKLLLILTLSFGCATAAWSQSLIKFGVRGGLDLEKASFDKDALSDANRLGFFIGPMLELRVPLVGLNVDAALLYHNYQVKATEEVTGESAKSTLQSLDIPITVKYVLGFGSKLSVFAGTGPQFSFNIGDKDILDNTYTLKSSDFSWNVSAGVRLLSHLQVAYNYNIGLGKTAEAKNDAVKKLLGKNLRNNTHQVSLSYIF